MFMLYYQTIPSGIFYTFLKGYKLLDLFDKGNVIIREGFTMLLDKKNFIVTLNRRFT